MFRLWLKYTKMEVTLFRGDGLGNIQKFWLDPAY
jgi:hypothetical protein